MGTGEGRIRANDYAAAALWLAFVAPAAAVPPIDIPAADADVTLGGGGAPPDPCLRDLDGRGVVDFGDLQQVIACWD